MSSSFGSALDDNRRTRIGTVTIIAPDSWNYESACRSLINTTSAAVWARSHRADIHFTADHPIFGTYPFSFQYGACQQPGLPINVAYSTEVTSSNGTKGQLHFSLGFVGNIFVLSKCLGRRLAREWAHYRYGVFDEGGIDNDQRHPSHYETYQTGQTIPVDRANICSIKSLGASVMYQTQRDSVIIY